MSPSKPPTPGRRAAARDQERRFENSRARQYRRGSDRWRGDQLAAMAWHLRFSVFPKNSQRVSPPVSRAGAPGTGGGRVLSSPRCTDPSALLNSAPGSVRSLAVFAVGARESSAFLSVARRFARVALRQQGALSPIGLDPGFTGMNTSSRVRDWRRHTRTVGCQPQR
jgi:hypothetical protein